MQEAQFIERRKEYRLPYEEKVIFADGQRASTAYSANISRGGMFATTLDPYPIETTGHLAFFLSNQPVSLCVKAKVVHIVFDRQRCEVECGVGFQFMDLNESQKSVLNLHILNEQSNYQEMKRLLAEERPNMEALERYLKKTPSLGKYGHDLLGLRYRVNRICTIFEPAHNPNFYAEDPLDEDKMSA